jgi:uncharacterized membrane protein YkvA (DUF1232 family)
MINWISNINDIPFYFRCFKELLLSLKDLIFFFKNLALILVVWISIGLLISPIDLIPELYFGVLGLVDDLIYMWIISYCVVRIKIYGD